MSQVLPAYMEPPIFDDNMEVVSDTGGLLDNADDIEIELDLVHEDGDHDNDVVVEDASTTEPDHPGLTDNFQEPSKDADMVDEDYHEPRYEDDRHQEDEYQFVHTTFDRNHQSFEAEMEDDYEEDIDAPIPGTSVMEPTTSVDEMRFEQDETRSPPVSQKAGESTGQTETQREGSSEPVQTSNSLTSNQDNLQDDYREPETFVNDINAEEVYDNREEFQHAPDIVTEEESTQTTGLISHTEAQSNEPEPDQPGHDANEESNKVFDKETYEAGENPSDFTAIHNVKVLYQENEISLFPPQEDDPSEMFFLEDEKLAHEPIGHLLDACRTVLGDYIGEEEELLLDIDCLDLHMSESTARSSTISLSQIVQVYLDLCRNDDASQSEPLYISLRTRPSLDATFHTLLEAVQIGKGLSQIERWEDYVEEAEEGTSPIEYAAYESDGATQDEPHGHVYEQVPEEKVPEEQGQEDVPEKHVEEEEVPEEDAQEEEVPEEHAQEDEVSEELVQEEEVSEERAQEEEEEEVSEEHAQQEKVPEAHVHEEQSLDEQRQTESVQPNIASHVSENDIVPSASEQSPIPKSPNINNIAQKEQSREEFPASPSTEDEPGEIHESMDANAAVAHKETNAGEEKYDNTEMGGASDLVENRQLASKKERSSPNNEYTASYHKSEPEQTEQDSTNQVTSSDYDQKQHDYIETDGRVAPSQMEPDMAEIYDRPSVSGGDNLVADTSTNGELVGEPITTYNDDEEYLEIDLGPSDAVQEQGNTGHFGGVIQPTESLKQETPEEHVSGSSRAVAPTGTPEPNHDLFDIDEDLFRSPQAGAENSDIPESQKLELPEEPRLPAAESSYELIPGTKHSTNYSEEVFEIDTTDPGASDQPQSGAVLQGGSPNHSKRPLPDDEFDSFSNTVPVTKRHRPE